MSEFLGLLLDTALAFASGGSSIMWDYAYNVLDSMAKRSVGKLTNQEFKKELMNYEQSFRERVENDPKAKELMDAEKKQLDILKAKIDNAQDWQPQPLGILEFIGDKIYKAFTGKSAYTTWDDIQNDINSETNKLNDIKDKQDKLVNKVADTVTNEIYEQRGQIKL